MATQKSPLSNSRLLTIGYQLYESRHNDWERRGKPRPIPYLRLSGDWLEAAGFEVGCKVSIQVTRRRLVMHVIED
ncbi:TPA: type I toxin-antitoxin system SymE family toxin [Pseudomonas aeruginosa]|nr:type I toxin-antitoxin system SymE family toxin [Pseudomonas aeruginosa]